jgi:DNA-directed RNA polymerase subunit RPC12/RpoP
MREPNLDYDPVSRLSKPYEHEDYVPCEDCQIDILVKGHKRFEGVGEFMAVYFTAEMKCPKCGQEWTHESIH